MTAIADATAEVLEAALQGENALRQALARHPALREQISPLLAIAASLRAEGPALPRAEFRADARLRFGQALGAPSLESAPQLETMLAAIGPAVPSQDYRTSARQRFEVALAQHQRQAGLGSASPLRVLSGSAAPRSWRWVGAAAAAVILAAGATAAAAAVGGPMLGAVVRVFAPSHVAPTLAGAPTLPATPSAAGPTNSQVVVSSKGTPSSRPTATVIPGGRSSSSPVVVGQPIPSTLAPVAGVVTPGSDEQVVNGPGSTASTGGGKPTVSPIAVVVPSLPTAPIVSVPVPAPEGVPSATPTIAWEFAPPPPVAVAPLPIN